MANDKQISGIAGQMKRAERLKEQALALLNKSKIQMLVDAGDIGSVDTLVDEAERIFMEILEINRNISVGLATTLVKERLDDVHRIQARYSDLGLSRHYPGDVMPPWRC